jgi:hypothetical protein
VRISSLWNVPRAEQEANDWQARINREWCLEMVGAVSGPENIWGSLLESWSSSFAESLSKWEYREEELHRNPIIMCLYNIIFMRAWEKNVSPH